MAKRKSKNDSDQTDKPSKRKGAKIDISDLVQTGLREAQTRFGKERCYVAAAHKLTERGVPIPCLALRELIESNVWPLSRFTQSGGPFGSYKSSFIFELARWYLLNGGWVAGIDTENKVSESLMWSILPPEFRDPERPDLQSRVCLLGANTINEWQQMLTRYVDIIDNTRPNLPQYPGLLYVDSMMGVDCAESVEKLRANGEAVGRNFSEAPLLISNFFRTMPSLLTGLPITIHASHHEKVDLNSPGGNTMRRAGGVAPDYYATLDLQFKRRAGTTVIGQAAEYEPIPSRPYHARTVVLKVRKSSMGTDHKQLTTLIKWRFEHSGDTMQQHTWWDWHGASADLMARRTQQLEDAGIMDVKQVKKPGVGSMMFSDALGIKESDAIPADEFGEAMEKHELMPAINACFGVQQHNVVAEPGNLQL